MDGHPTESDGPAVEPPRTSRGKLSLLALPELLAEWDYTRNDVDPAEVSHGSVHKCWWTCARGHHWQAAPSQRIGRGTGCPFCTGHRASPEYNLAVVAPDVAAEWHPTRNDRTPETVMPQSNLLFWWRCAEGHDWQAKPNNRAAGNLTGCPYCAGQRATADNNLTVIAPALAAEWHPDRNPCDPEEVAPHSNRLYWWMCSRGHEWRTTPNNRLGRGSDCPACADAWTLPVFRAWLSGQLDVNSAAWEPVLRAAGILYSRSMARVVAEGIIRDLLHPEEIAAFAAGTLNIDLNHLLAHPSMRDVALHRPVLADTHRREVMERDGGRCQLCGTDELPEIDHFYPVCLGGDNDPSNYWVLCRTCNGSKSGAPPTAAMIECWLASGRELPWQLVDEGRAVTAPERLAA